MITAEKRIIELKEYEPLAIPKDEFPESFARIILERHSTKISLEPPSFINDHKWKLTSQGWIGCIPLSRDVSILMQPKVELSNVFGMLEYAYKLKGFILFDGFFDASSLREFYSRLAMILARRISERARKGFYKEYVPRSKRLPYVRGRINIRSMVKMPWEMNLQCDYQENTFDIEDNQIIAWTLFCILRSGMCSERALSTVHRAHLSLSGLVSLRPFRSRDCIKRNYNRLNQDYQSLHALCRFFLENAGPSHEIGDYRMIPFIVDMDRLYELFVAEWLKAHLPKNLKLGAKEKVYGDSHSHHFDIDLVLYDSVKNVPLCVLDTKYKAPDTPSSSDLQEVMAYANSKMCKNAALVYPVNLPRPFDESMGQSDIHIRSMEFSLDGNLEQSGEEFKQRLLSFVSV
ncbi:McrC family protein [Candidatus Omnitrophota bacterium]